MIFTLISRTNLGIYETFSVIKYSSIYNTIIGSSLTGILCVIISLLVILNLSKKNKILRYFFESIMHFGFTLPGIVIALSFVYFSINYMFPIYQTWVILIFGYIVKNPTLLFIDNLMVFFAEPFLILIESSGAHKY